MKPLAPFILGILRKRPKPCITKRRNRRMILKAHLRLYPSKEICKLMSPRNHFSDRLWGSGGTANPPKKSAKVHHNMECVKKVLRDMMPI